jgi:ribosomal protein S21
MQLSTRKYGGDPMRTYKVLMRKLSKEGHYQEVKEKEFFKSKSQKLRENKVRDTIRTKKKLRIIQEHLAKELPRAKPKPKVTDKQKKLK